MRTDRLVGTVILAFIVALTATTPLAAQWRAAAGPWAADAPSAPADLPALEMRQASQPASTLLLTVVGAAASLGGFYGGGMAGYEADRQHFHWEYGDSPGFVGFMGGSLIGGALATPLLVNAANGGRGSLRTAYGASALIAGAGVAALAIDHRAPPGTIIFLAAPLAQVVSAVVIERRTSR